MNETPHILVVDDHRDIRESLSRYLQKHEFRVTMAEDAAAARRLLRASAVDLVVLDIMMPGEDGLALCRYLRENTDLPVILLSAMGEETDRIVGLEMGADDYIGKPFNPRELLARIKAVMRRARSLPVGAARQLVGRPGERIGFDRWILDVGRRELSGEDGVAISLSTAEFALLSAFVNHPGMVLSRDQLLDLTRGRAAEVFDRSIDNQVSRLRRRIEADPKNPMLIKTVWGGGYAFAPEIRRL
ncbi:MAG TPA: response regulator [Xanthobacteraceae bacterium]|nr:response regulator [Xanthobacteraceae bacterium]